MLLHLRPRLRSALDASLPDVRSSGSVRAGARWRAHRECNTTATAGIASFGRSSPPVRWGRVRFLNELRVAMRNKPAPRLACIRVLLTIALASCGGGDVGPNTPSVATVSVTPGTLNLLIGQKGQFAATPRDEAGNALSGHAVSWTSLTPAVASVDGSGLVTALGVGAATITATSEGKSGTAAVVSLVPVATVSVTPDHLDLRIGLTGQL